MTGCECAACVMMADRLLGGSCEHLATLGIEVERELSLTRLEQSSDCVHAHLRHADGRGETVTTPWLLGCDGAHSATWYAIGLDFKARSTTRVSSSPHLCRDAAVPRAQPRRT
jgi:2-polyprenyl-6-methoxyphenol hydroxylase-like FAD-dependent oxidoreductase